MGRTERHLVHHERSRRTTLIEGIHCVVAGLDELVIVILHFVSVRHTKDDGTSVSGNA